MAGILKNKKGQMVDFAIAFIIIVATTALLTNNISSNQKTIEIGARQYAMLSAYAEGEKALEYLKTASEISVSDVVGSCEYAKTVSDKTMVYKIEPLMKDRILKYTSTNPRLNITIAPFYTYSVSVQQSSISITGLAGDNIKVTSDSDKFTYSLNGNFKSTMSCDKLKVLREGSGQQFIG